MFSISYVPEVVLCSIVCEWCGLMEFAKFDSAISQRNFLHRLYSRKQFTVTSTWVNYEWCTRKGLKLSEIVINCALKNIAHIPTAAFSTLKTISCDVPYNNMSMDPVYDLINLCVQLNGIKISGYHKPFDFQKIKPHIWERLTYFECNILSINQKFICFLIQYCRQLTGLKYRNCNDDSEPRLIEIIKNNSNLRTMVVHTDALSINTSLLNTLSERLSQLTYISLSDVSEISVRALVDFIVTVQPSLKRLQFKSYLHLGFDYCFSNSIHHFHHRSVERSVYLNLDHRYNEISSTDDVLYIFKHLTTLDHITIVGNMHGLLSDEVFQLIASMNKQLSHLTVRSCGEKYNSVDKVKQFFTASDECFEQKDKDKTTNSGNITFTVQKITNSASSE